MLDRITIQNYRCFERVSVELRPLSVLVGQNDSGKSSFLSAIETLFVGGNLPLADHWRLAWANRVVIEGRAGNQMVRLDQQGPPGHKQVPTLNSKPVLPDSIQSVFGGKAVSLVRPGAALLEAFANGPAFFLLPSAGPPMESEGHADAAGIPELGSDGSGVAALVDYLLRRDRARFNQFAAALRERVPGLQEVNVGTPSPQRRQLSFLIENGLEIPADRASVGVRLLVFFLALVHHPDPPGIILLEEPENGVHPRRLADIVHLLRDISQGTPGGRPTQVILTTHSPYLLDHVTLGKDQVLVFRRTDDG